MIRFNPAPLGGSDLWLLVSRFVVDEKFNLKSSVNIPGFDPASFVAIINPQIKRLVLSPIYSASTLPEVYSGVFQLPGYYRHRQRNQAMPELRKKINMILKVLVLGAVVATFSVSAFAGTNAYLLKAPAASNVNAPAETPVATIAYVGSTPALLTPRAQDNHIKVVKGADNDHNSTLTCRNTMVASPKAVGECASHANMPGCVTVAALR